MASLTEFPTELIETIAGNLELKDFKALRLSCKELQSKSLHLFRKKFLRKISVRLTRRSLEQFLELSRDEKYRGYVQAVMIQYDEDSFVDIFSPVSSFRPGTWITVSRYLMTRVPEIGAKEHLYGRMGRRIQADNEPGLAKYNDLVQEERKMFSLGLDSKMLSYAFAGLPHLKAVSLWDYKGRCDECVYDPYARKSRYYGESVLYAPAHPLFIMFSALETSGKAKEIEELTIRFCVLDMDTIDAGIGEKKTAGARIRDFLKLAPNLEELRINEVTFEDQPALMDITTGTSLPNLRMLVLEQVQLDFEALRALLDTYKETLKYLKLKHVVLIGEPRPHYAGPVWRNMWTWEHAFARIGATPHLEHVVVHKLQWAPKPGHGPEGPTLFRSPQGVRACLEGTPLPPMPPPLQRSPRQSLASAHDLLEESFKANREDLTPEQREWNMKRSRHGREKENHLRRTKEAALYDILSQRGKYLSWGNWGPWDGFAEPSDESDIADTVESESDNFFDPSEEDVNWHEY